MWRNPQVGYRLLYVFGGVSFWCALGTFAFGLDGSTAFGISLPLGLALWAHAALLEGPLQDRHRRLALSSEPLPVSPAGSPADTRPPGQ
jgi:hypothetical protein